MLLSAYLLVVVLLSLHGLHRVALLTAWWRRRGSPPAEPPAPAAWPRVLVQLPVYNERDVAARLVDAVAALDYPKDKLEIQLLDDSTDDTARAAAPAVARARAAGLDVSVLRRPSREGFKAGALAWGLSRSDAELVAVFDADFVPRPGFLRRVVPHLLQEGVGMVQCRWGHLNAADNPLTLAQATMLDGHFGVEQPARHRSGLWFNFNGTAGAWRRAAIEAGGGWQHDTLTEDLDLSYRAALAGWRFVYLREDVVPAELPDGLAAFRAQQRRWARGSIQTLRKLGGRIVAAPFPLAVRAEALSHLCANAAWPLVVALAVLLPLVVLARGEASSGHLWLDLPAFGFSIGVNAVFYLVAAEGRAARVPLALFAGIGLSVGQAAASLQGWLGGPAVFERTPKNGGGAGSYRGATLGSAQAPRWLLAGVEGALAALHFAVTIVALSRGSWGSVPFLLLFGGGFGWFAGLGLAELLRAPRAAALPEPEPVAGK